jgi:hypothetical protein
MHCAFAMLAAECLGLYVVDIARGVENVFCHDRLAWKLYVDESIGAEQLDQFDGRPESRMVTCHRRLEEVFRTDPECNLS